MNLSYKKLAGLGTAPQNLPESESQIFDQERSIAAVLPRDENSTTTSTVTNNAKFVYKPEPHVTLNTSSRETDQPKTSNVQRKLRFILVSIVVVIIVAVIVYLSVLKKDESEDTPATLSQSEETDQDLGNGIHLFKRNRWGGRPILDGYQNRTLVHPIKLVIIGHTASSQCMTIETCATALQSIQSHHVRMNYHDIGYNFLVGGDGNIYQALGWEIRNYLRNNSIQLQFLGNHMYDQVLDRQRVGVQALLDYGVKLGKLDKDYFLVAHSQVTPTLSPGRKLLAAMKLWPHYRNDTLY